VKIMLFAKSSGGIHDPPASMALSLEVSTFAMKFFLDPLEEIKIIKTWIFKDFFNKMF
jgi:hypothetical protein